MKNKIVEFARLPETVHELAIEHFDNAELRNDFLETMAMDKIYDLLTSVALPHDFVIEFVKTIIALDKLMSHYDSEISLNIEGINQVIQNIKTRAKEVANETCNARH